MAHEPLTAMAQEILWDLWCDGPKRIELDQSQFPWIYVVRQPGKHGGKYFPSTPVVALLTHGYIEKEPNTKRFMLTQKGLDWGANQQE